eukprot:1876090-Pyramimonas_sp.AAC.1
MRRPCARDQFRQGRTHGHANFYLTHMRAREDLMTRVDTLAHVHVGGLHGVAKRRAHVGCTAARMEEEHTCLRSQQPQQPQRKVEEEGDAGVGRTETGEECTHCFRTCKGVAQHQMAKHEQ